MDPRLQENIENITKLSSRVVRILGQNPGLFTLQGTNTYLIGSGATRTLLDTGEGKVEYLDLLIQAMKQEQCDKIQSIIITHHHYDHVGGLNSIFQHFGAIPIYKLHVGPSHMHHDEVAKYEEHESKSSMNELVKANIHYINDNDEFACDHETTLRVVATPGHCSDHLALFLKEESSVFSGDCVLGAGTCVFLDLHSYMKSLQKLLSLAPKIIYPGHGPIVSQPIEWINTYISHRNQREQQILSVIQKQQQEQKMSISAEDIVKIVYKDIPVTHHPAALNNVQHHLKKLLIDGVVSQDHVSQSWSLASTDIAEAKL